MILVFLGLSGAVMYFTLAYLINVGGEYRVERIRRERDKWNRF